MVSVPADYMNFERVSHYDVFVVMGREDGLYTYMYPSEGKFIIRNLWSFIPKYLLVANGGKSTLDCGKPAEGNVVDDPCDTLFHALNSYKGMVNDIRIAREEYTETEVNTHLNKTLIIQSNGKENKTLASIKVNGFADTASSADALFTVGNGRTVMTVTFKEIELKVNVDTSKVSLPTFTVLNSAKLELRKSIISGTNTSSQLPCPVIRATAGTLSLMDTSISNFSFSNASLLEISASNIAFDGINKFTDITKSEGNGSVFDVTVSATDTMALQKCTFTSCSVKKGNGGAVYIRYNKGQLRIGSDISESKKKCTTVFRNCSAGKGEENNTLTYSSSFNADTPSTGAGGGIYLEVQDVNEDADNNADSLVIGSVYFDKCQADFGGTSIYAHAITPKATQLISGNKFWKEVTKLSGNKDKQFTILTDDGTEEKAKGYKARFHWWIILVILVSVISLAALVLFIVCYCYRQHRSSSYSQETSTSDKLLGSDTTYTSV